MGKDLKAVARSQSTKKRFLKTLQNLQESTHVVAAFSMELQPPSLELY